MSVQSTKGFPYADVLSSLGCNAFATEDLAFALSYVFRNAEALQVSTEGYSLWGSSAGARMAASIGSHGTARFGGEELPRPIRITPQMNRPPSLWSGGRMASLRPPPCILADLGRTLTAIWRQ